MAIPLVLLQQQFNGQYDWWRSYVHYSGNTSGSGAIAVRGISESDFK